MTRNDFKKLLETMIAEEWATIGGKGEEYTRGQEDRLSSFKETASFAGVKPSQVCMIYLNKHYQSLAHYVATGETKSNESIEGRIMDIRVYMALMRSIIQEERKVVKQVGPETLLKAPEARCAHCRRPDAGNLLAHPNRPTESLCSACLILELEKQRRDAFGRGLEEPCHRCASAEAPHRVDKTGGGFIRVCHSCLQAELFRDSRDRGIPRAS